MRLVKKLLFSLLPGAAAAVIAVVLSQQFLLHIADIVRWVGGVAGLKESDIALYVSIFSQLHDAVLVSPWLPALLIGCGINALAAFIITRGRMRRFVIDIGICILLLILAVAAALWFTTVNGVMLGDMIRLLIPILESGLL